MSWQQVYDPFGSMVVSTALAAVPAAMKQGPPDAETDLRQYADHTPVHNLTAWRSIMRVGSISTAAVAIAAFCVSIPAHAVDTAAAEALAKKSNCMKCHSVSAKKEGPSFKETAAKYKGKADAEQKLVTHLTTNPKIKVDGKEEEHDNLKSKNEADVRNVVQWILAQ